MIKAPTDPDLPMGIVHASTGVKFQITLALVHGRGGGAWADQAGSLPLCLASLFQHKLPDFVVLRLTGFVFLLLLSSLLQKHKTCRPQSNKIKQFVLEKTRTSVDRRQGPATSTIRQIEGGKVGCEIGKYYFLVKKIRKSRATHIKQGIQMNRMI